MALRHTAVAVGSMLLVAAGSLVGGPAAEATVTTFNDGVLIYKVGDPGEVSIGDGLVDACVTTCAANNGVGIDDSGVLMLPSQVSDGFLTYNVTEISDRAFSDWSGIFGVTIPGTVRRVGNQAFYRGTPGTGLSSLTIEPGVDLTIGTMAFAGTALTHLDIPSRVRTIEMAAFIDVPNLQTIEINGGDTPASIATSAFRLGNPAPNSDLDYVRFRGVKPTIADNAFDGHVGCELRYQSTETSWSAPFATMSDCTWISTDAPSITASPADATTRVGDPATTFSVAATGNGELYYQWQRNGVGIPGENSATLTISNPSLSNSGDQYDVVVTNWVGSQTSSAATLTVNPAPATPTKAAQTANLAIAKKLKRNRSYTLPTRTTEGQPIAWSVSKTGKCKVNGGKLKCRKATGKRTTTLTARAPATSTLFEFVQTVKRKVG